MNIEELIDKVFSIETEEEFLLASLDVFKFQYNNNKVYRQWCDHISSKPVERLEDIPFLPISFFKTHRVVSFEGDYQHFFKSSGTSSLETSKHYIYDLNVYQRSFLHSFKEFFGEPSQYSFIALLPNYTSQGNSSLVYMVDSLINLSNYNSSGFYEGDYSQVARVLESNHSSGIKTILFGTTYALLDLIESETLGLESLIVIETGGMKGRRKEIPKQELHNILKKGFGVDKIYSEYGMCELLSQAYSMGGALFRTPSQMRVLIRDIYDPLSYIENNRTGGINIIDLSNIYSCSFIATEDLGIKLDRTGFEVRGRMDNTIIRGCNLLYEE